MIVFISDYPCEAEARDGYAQRVLAIDEIFSQDRRTYLDLSWRRHRSLRTRYPAPEVVVHHANAFLHAPFIRHVVARAQAVYVHSAYNLLRSVPFLDPEKSVLDLHGVVPEEEALAGRRMAARWCGFVERKAVLEFRTLILVTERMLEHLEEKYGPGIGGRSVICPILREAGPPSRLGEDEEGTICFTYLGGIQPWQNVDLIMDAIQQLRANNPVAFRRSRFRLFFPRDAVSELRHRYGAFDSMNNVHLDTAPREKALQEIASAHYGFVLRDPSLVNRVACPTKLVEYMALGVVPVVRSPDIGDFPRLGYRYLEVDEFLSGRWDLRQWRAAVEENFAVMDKLRKMVERGRAEIAQAVGGT